jgi:hypothetical protein
MLSEKLRRLSQWAEGAIRDPGQRLSLGRALEQLADECTRLEVTALPAHAGPHRISIHIDEATQLARDVLQRRREPTQEDARLLALCALVLHEALESRRAAS